MIKGIALIVLVAFGLSNALEYPMIDETSNWNVSQWLYDAAQQTPYFTTVNKYIWTSSGVRTNKAVFGKITIPGVRFNGTPYKLATELSRGQYSYSDHVYYYGSYRLPNGLTFNLAFRFYKDGRFSFASSLSPMQGSTTTLDVYVVMDQNLYASTDNIVEFVWNGLGEGFSLNPPSYPNALVNDGVIVYNGYGLAVDYWAAVPHEITVQYPALAIINGQSNENTAFCRILRAATSNTQFGAILWSQGYAVDMTQWQANTARYWATPGNPPAVTLTTNIQTVDATSTDFPAYSHNGTDQMMCITVKGPGNQSPGFMGKVFQRSNGRPMKLDVWTHPLYTGAEPTLRWNFDKNYTIRNVGGQNRNMTTALSELTNGAGNVNIIPHDGALPLGGGWPSAGGNITNAQLHNLMASYRDYTTVTRENVAEWKLDCFIVNWIYDNYPTAGGVYFDYDIGPNNIEGEASAVFWGRLSQFANITSDYQKRWALLGVLHESGHAIGFGHSWSNCPTTSDFLMIPNTYCTGGCVGAPGCAADLGPWTPPASNLPPGATYWIWIPVNGRTCASFPGLTSEYDCFLRCSGCTYGPSSFGCIQECWNNSNIPVDGSIMSYAAVDRSSVRFNDGANLSWSPGNPNRNEIGFYKNAPEAWVKTGRYGSGFQSWQLALPPTYITY